MRILLATDGSEDASQAVAWLLQFPAPADTAVGVVSAVREPLIDEGHMAVAWRALWKQAQHAVDEARDRLRSRWPETTARVIDGDPRKALVDAAATSAADLIVLGARGLGAVGAFLLGSVSLAVARQAPCPVLVCRGAARPVRTVTVALDGSDGARTALTYLSRLLLPPGLTMCLVGVVEPLPYPRVAPKFITGEIMAALKDYEENRRRELEEIVAVAAEELRPRAGAVLTATPVGSAAEAVLREATKQGSDLIVVGARGLGTLERLLLGSVSESILRHATCPVLIVGPRR